MPVAASIQSIVELATGRDYITGEDTSRVLAAVGIVAGLVGAKGFLKGASKADDIVEGVADVARRFCCFAAGTLVMTETGLRPIEEIEVGDLVLSRDELTGETALKPVTELTPRHDREIWELKLEIDGESQATESFETTDDHPWRNIDGGWTITEQLMIGSKIVRAHGGPATVIGIIRTGRTVATYNLEVAEFHTYFVGTTGIWVHNNCLDVARNALTRIFNIEGRSVPLLGGSPVVGRTLKNGLVEIKTSISGSINDAADIFRRLVGDAAKPLPNGAGFRAVLEDGREVIFRPKSTGFSSDGIPKIEIRDPRFGVSEKVNFTR